MGLGVDDGGGRCERWEGWQRELYLLYVTTSRGLASLGAELTDLGKFEKCIRASITKQPSQLEDSNLAVECIV